MAQYANFILAEVRSAVLAGDDAIDVRLKSPGALPAATLPDAQRLLLVDDLRRPTKFEIISYMGTLALIGTGSDPGVRLTDVQRGLDGTTAQAWSEGDCATNDLFASQLLPLGEDDAGDDDVLMFVQGGGLALRQVSADQLTDATPGNPILLQAMFGSPATPSAGEVLIWYQETLAPADQIVAIFDNGTTDILVTK